MENDNEPIDPLERIARLEEQMAGVMEVVIPAVSRQGGEIAAQTAFLYGLALLMPPDAPALRTIRNSFEKAYVTLLNDSVNPEYTEQFETVRDLLCGALEEATSLNKDRS